MVMPSVPRLLTVNAPPAFVTVAPCAIVIPLAPVLLLYIAVPPLLFVTAPEIKIPSVPLFVNVVFPIPLFLTIALSLISKRWEVFTSIAEASDDGVLTKLLNMFAALSDVVK